MKKIVTTLMIAGLALSFASCQKELDNAATTGPGEVVVLTLNATHEVGTKTVLEGTSPKWAAGDKVTVMYKKTGESTWSSSISSEASSADSYVTATFSTSLTSPDESKDAYAIYPANNLSQDVADKAKITIASTQHPTGTSFDGGSDILISKPFNPTTNPVTTQFARLGAVLKISIDNATLASEKLVNLSVEGANPLAGDVLVGLSDKEVKGIENGSNTVTAEFESGLLIGGNVVYLIVKPQTLANGSHLIINGQTENYTFTKDIELSQDIHLNPGHIVPLRISIDDPELKNKVFAVAYFDDNSGTGANDGSWSGSIASNDIVLPDGWSHEKGNGAYQCVKFGSGSAAGSVSSNAISIPAVYTAVKLYFKAGAWNGGSEKTTLNISADNADIKDNENKDVSSITIAKGSWTPYSYDLKNIKGNVTITISSSASSNNRFFLDDFIVYYGDKPKKPCGLAYANSSIIKSSDDAAFTNALTNPNSLVVSYESSNTSVATVDTYGEVTIKGIGETRITASTSGNSEFTAGSAYYDLTIIAPPTLAFSWTRSGSKDSVTDGYSLTATATAKSTGYYQDNSSVGTVYYVMVKKNSSIWSSTPTKILFEATVGAGSDNTDFSAVSACLVDASGNDIDGTEITVTTHITAAAGDVYSLEFPPVPSACGVKIYHAKESGKNIRYFGMSLSYLE